MGSLMHPFSFLLLWRPDVLLALMLAGAVYFALVGPLRHHFALASRPTTGQIGATCTVLLLLYTAMGSPLNLVAERMSFTAYVLQMLIVTQVVAPLVFLALPPWLLEAVVTIPGLRRVFKVVCSPVAATVTYNALSTAFLLPGLLTASLTNDLVHAVVQYALMLSAVFLWWPLLSRVPSLPRLSPGAQLIYLLFAMNFMMPVTVFLFFSQTPWYTLYLHAPLALSPMADQEVGALLMAGGMWLVYGLRALQPFLSHSDAVWYE